MTQKKPDVDERQSKRTEKDDGVTRREILQKLAYIPPVVTSLLLSRNVMAGQSCPGQCPAQCAPLCRPICRPVCTPVHP